MTAGIAFTVITRPTATITAADRAGSARIRGPSSRARPNARRASTATRPIAVIVAARPTLNATISAHAERDDKPQPEGERVERDRAQEHDERRRAGQQAGGGADPEDPAHTDVALGGGSVGGGVVV